MKTIKINNNYLHMPTSRLRPLIQIDESSITIDSLFVTDVSYTKYLIPVIKIVDKLQDLFGKIKKVLI